VEVLTPIGVTPTNEAQARELAPLREDPDAMREVWQEARAEHGDNVTAADLRRRVQDRLAVHFSSASSEWLTPSPLLERVLAVLGTIDLDPCSNSHDQPNVPAQQHFTSEDDGLAQDWHGTVYLNPPYGRAIEAWVQKLLDEYSVGRTTAAIALLPARTDTHWFRLLAEYPICFLDGRLRFSGYDSAAPFPSAAVYLGRDPDRFAAAFGEIGQIRPSQAPTDDDEPAVPQSHAVAAATATEVVPRHEPMLPAAPLVADSVGALPIDASEEGDAETAARPGHTTPRDRAPVQPSAELDAEAEQRRLLDDFLAALRDAPRFGLVSYAPDVLLALLSDPDARRAVAQGLSAVRSWLTGWEQVLGIVAEPDP
jgi:hypothetical protein